MNTLINKNHIGTRLTPFTVEVEKAPLRAFAKATGQTDPVYLDETAARAAGYPSLPIAPTYLFCLEMASPNPQEVYELLGIEYARVLHGEQHFVYHQPVFAGDVLSFAPVIAEIYDRKDGALEFVVWETRVEAKEGLHVADLRSVMVVRPEKQSRPS